MKKIVYKEDRFEYVFSLLDSTDYIKIEEDGQHVDDKYINSWGGKINSYIDPLKKDELIIRNLYRIGFAFPYYNHYTIGVRNLRHYECYNSDDAKKINGSLDTKNSVFDYKHIGNFDYVKKRIIDVFSEKMEVNIE